MHSLQEEKNTSINYDDNTLGNSDISALKYIASSALKDGHNKVTIVLEKASLETYKTKKGIELLSADSHKSLLSKMKKNISEFRPDILHSSLMSLLDSPLNKAGLLRVYIHTNNNILIEVNPHIRIPRTYPRFAGLMVQLLNRLSIKASAGSEKLLKVIKNPVTQYFPPNSIRIGTSVTGEKVNILEFLASYPKNTNFVFMFGVHPHGKAEVDYVERTISLSSFSLSANVAINRLLSNIEILYGIQ